MFWIKTHRGKHINIAPAQELEIEKLAEEDFPKNRYGLIASFGYTQILIGAWETEEEAERHLSDLMEAMGRAFPYHVPRGPHAA